MVALPRCLFELALELVENLAAGVLFVRGDGGRHGGGERHARKLDCEIPGRLREATLDHGCSDARLDGPVTPFVGRVVRPTVLERLFAQPSHVFDREGNFLCSIALHEDVRATSKWTGEELKVLEHIILCPRT